MLRGDDEVRLDRGLVLAGRRDDLGRPDPPGFVHLVAMEEQAARRLGCPGGDPRAALPGHERLARLLVFHEFECEECADPAHVADQGRARGDRFEAFAQPRFDLSCAHEQVTLGVGAQRRAARGHRERMTRIRVAGA